MAAAEAALNDPAHLEHVCNWTRAERSWLTAELKQRGYRVVPSQANFVLVEVPVGAVDLQAQLFERGVIVRPMDGYGLGHTLRISIGSRAENERLLAALA